MGPEPLQEVESAWMASVPPVETVIVPVFSNVDKSAMKLAPSAISMLPELLKMSPIMLIVSPDPDSSITP